MDCSLQYKGLIEGEKKSNDFEDLGIIEGFGNIRN